MQLDELRFFHALKEEQTMAEQIQYDYFYGEETAQYSFLKIPWPVD